MPKVTGSQSYSQATQRGGSPRESEGRALLEAARRMDEACRAGDPAAMRAAVRLNWRLWTIFQAELSDEKSSVPLEVRRNMLSLCNFVDKRIVAILAAPSPAQFTVLININRQIAAGLLSAPAAPQQASARRVSI